MGLRVYLRKERKMQIKINVGDMYTHHRRITSRYVVIHIANLHSDNPDYPITIIYRGVTNGYIWCKSLSNFMATMELLQRKEKS